jgi:hypothetical protein
MASATGAAVKMPHYYQSASSVVLLASPTASVQNGGNPFLSFSPSLTLTADAVSREVMAPGTVNQLAARGFTASYTVELPTYTTSTTGSVLLVTVTGTDAAGTEGTLRAVTAQIGTQLALLQHGIPNRGRVRAATLSFTPQATLSISQTARPLVVVVALLLAVCLALPIVADGLVTRRQDSSGTSRRSRATRRSPAQNWTPLDIPAIPRRPAFPEEPAIPGRAKGRADRLGDDDPARGEPRLHSSSSPSIRNGGPSRQASRPTGSERVPGTPAGP